MTKKCHQKFWEIDDIFWGNANFFGKHLRKIVQKFRKKFAPPDSEVLDPLVSETAASRRNSTGGVAKMRARMKHMAK